VGAHQHHPASGPRVDAVAISGVPIACRLTPEFKLWFVANDDPRVRSEILQACPTMRSCAPQ
jgi:hypothetical protein